MFTFISYWFYSLVDYSFSKQLLYSLVWGLNINYINLTLIIYIVSFSFKWLTPFFIVVVSFYSTFLKKTLSNDINSNLLLGLNNIHPFFLYVSFFFYLKIFKFNWSNKGLILYNVLYLSLCSLLLGSLWSSGNNIWGFFWVNDPIEYILLVYSIFLASTLHLVYKFKNNYYFFITYLIIIISAYSLRLGIFFTRHNFFDTKNLNYVYCYIVFFFVSLVKLYFMYLLNLFLYLKVFIFCFLIIRFFSLYTVVTLNVKFIHLFILLLFLSWIKFKFNNNINFIHINTGFFNNIYYKLNTQTYMFFSFFKKHKLFLFSSNIFKIYKFKVMYFKKVVISYIHFFLINWSLISIYKIYK